MPIQLHLDVRVSEKRFQLYLLSVFSLLALSIAMGGIYGVIAYSVSQRTHEIGIRMALGAQATDVARLVLMQGARLIGCGLLFGLAAAIVVGRMMESRLFQVSGWDPVTLAIIAVLIACAGLLACFVPARRATKVVPMIALRAE